MYKGVQMRSRLEASFAAALDRGHYQWTYEPHCFADETGQYLPDFRLDADPRVARITGLNDGPTYAEVKPPSIGATDLEAALSRMEIIWSSEPEVQLMLHLWGAGQFFVTVTGLRSWIRLDDAHPGSIFDTPYLTGRRREADGAP